MVCAQQTHVYLHGNRGEKMKKVNWNSLKSVLIIVSFLMDFTLLTWRGDVRGNIYFDLLFVATVIKDIAIYRYKKKKNT